jgi:hypothetical protein
MLALNVILPQNHNNIDNNQHYYDILKTNG